MSTTPLLRLTTWARSLRAADVPPEVMDLARLQHLAGAGAVRASRATPGAAAVDAAHEAGPARHAAHLARFALDDWQVGGRTGLGALPQAWAGAAGHSLDDVIVATIAANEIAGRIGLATLLGPRWSGSGLWPAACAGAVAAGLLAGRSPEALAGEISGALSAARRRGLTLSPGEVAADPTRPGWEAARLVARGQEDPGSLTVLAADSPFWKEACARPLPGALHGEGHAWLTTTLVVPPEPGAPWTQVAVQAVAEILRRHVKAAEKRLRSDQVERIEIRVPFPVWAAERAAAAHDGPGSLLGSIARLCAVRVAWHALTPALLDDEELVARAEELAALASTVDVVHDWGLSVGMVEGFARAVPVFEGFGPADYRSVRCRLKEAGAWPGWSPPDLAAIAKARPNRLVAELLRGRPLDAESLPGFQWHLPVSVRLYTTRGGWWPERRALPAGTEAGGDLEAVAVERFGDPAAAEALLALPGDTPATTFLDGLGV